MTTPTSVSLNPLLLSLSSLFLSLNGTPSPSFSSPFPSLSLHLQSLSPFQNSLLGQLIYDAAHKVLYAAICAPMHKGNPKAARCSLTGIHILIPKTTAAEGLNWFRMYPSANKAASVWKKQQQKKQGNEKRTEEKNDILQKTPLSNNMHTLRCLLTSAVVCCFGFLFIYLVYVLWLTPLLLS